MKWTPSFKRHRSAQRHASIAGFRRVACPDFLGPGRTVDWCQTFPCWDLAYWRCYPWAQFSCSFRPPLKVGHSQVAVAGLAIALPSSRMTALAMAWRAGLVAQPMSSTPSPSVGYCQLAKCDARDIAQSCDFRRYLPVALKYMAGILTSELDTVDNAAPQPIASSAATRVLTSL